MLTSVPRFAIIARRSWGVQTTEQRTEKSSKKLKKSIDKVKAQRYTVKAVAGNEREREGREAAKAPWKLYSENNKQAKLILSKERQQRESETTKRKKEPDNERSL